MIVTIVFAIMLVVASIKAKWIELSEAENQASVAWSVSRKKFASLLLGS